MRVFRPSSWALLLSCIATALVYSIGLTGPLVFDDTHNLAPVVGWLEGNTGWQSAMFGNQSGLFGRPVSMGSLLLNVYVFGPGVWGLKLGNLLIHIVNGALVFWLFRLLTSRGGMARGLSPSATTWLPWLGASVWLLHPLLASSVLYVIQRMAMLSAMFTLLAIISYMLGRMALLQGRSRTGWSMLALVPAWTLLAALSKENGILAPALCAVIELVLFMPLSSGRMRRLSIGLVVCTLALPAFAAALLTVSQHPLIIDGYANRSFSLAERLLTQPRVLWSYVAALLVPNGPSLGLYHDAFPLSKSLFDRPTTLLALIAWAATLTAAWRLRVSIPGFAIGTGMFLVGHALESTVFPLLIYFEHRNYLPAIGAIWALMSLAAVGVERIHGQMHHPARVFKAASILLLLALGGATAAQSLAWSDQASLLAQGLRHHPESRWLRADLIAYSMAQQPPATEAARQHAGALLAAKESSTRRLGAISTLIVDCSVGAAAQATLIEIAFAGKPEPMEADLLRAVESLGDGVRSHPCLGLSASDMAARLTDQLDRTALPATAFSIWRLRYLTAQLRLSSKDLDSAHEQALLAWRSGQADPQVAVFIAELDISQGKMQQALIMLDEAMEKIAKDDIVGKSIIDGYRQHILAVNSD